MIIMVYQEFAREITKMWDVKTRTVLIVVGTLGATSIRFQYDFNTIQSFSWGFKMDISIEISSIMDSPYPRKSVYSVRSFFSFSRLVYLDHWL